MGDKDIFVAFTNVIVGVGENLARIKKGNVHSVKNAGRKMNRTWWVPITRFLHFYFGTQNSVLPSCNISSGTLSSRVVLFIQE